MTGLIILAAGESRRLGRPKQNLIFHDKTLLQRAIDTGLHSKCQPIIVVLGANSEQILPTIRQEQVKIIHNPNWEEGMASSIRMAINEFEKNDLVSRAVIMLCDQPFVTTELIGKLQQEQTATGKPIVVCRYQDAIGVPVLFDRSLFKDLLSLTGNEGAKKIIKDHQGNTASILFEMGRVDIDTQEDYQRLTGPDN